MIAPTLSRAAPAPLRGLPCSSSPQQRPCSTLSRRAARQSRRETTAAALPSGLEKWAALSADDAAPPAKSSSYFEPPPLTSDPDYLSNLDDLCTRALRAMLKGDADSLRPGSSWADDVSALGNYCVSARQPPHVDGARFAFFLLELAANRWPAEADDLVGVYKEASEKMHGLLEESGWRMALKVKMSFFFPFFFPPLPSSFPPLSSSFLLLLLSSSRFLSLFSTITTGREGGRHGRCGRLRRSLGGDRELRKGWRRRRGRRRGREPRGVIDGASPGFSLLAPPLPIFFPVLPFLIRIGQTTFVFFKSTQDSIGAFVCNKGANQAKSLRKN